MRISKIFRFAFDVWLLYLVWMSGADTIIKIVITLLSVGVEGNSIIINGQMKLITDMLKLFEEFLIKKENK